MKRCRRCHTHKRKTAFNVSRRNKDGLQAYCKVCQSTALREWYKANPGAYTRHSQRNYVRDPAKAIFFATRIRARKQGVPFELSADDIRELLFAAPVCPVLGITLSRRFAVGTRLGPSDSAPSLDRDVPKRGYVSGNVAVVSQRANRLKNDASLEEVRRIYSYMKRRAKCGR